MLMRHIDELRPNSLALQCCRAEARAAWRRAFCLKPEPDFPNIDFFGFFLTIWWLLTKKFCAESPQPDLAGSQRPEVDQNRTSFATHLSREIFLNKT